MSLGATFLRAAINGGNRALLFEINLDWLLEDERPAFEFTREHTRRYGQLPTLETLAQNGHQLLAAGREPAHYYANRIRNRAAFNVINETLPELTAAMQVRNLDNAEEALSTMLRGAKAVRNTESVSTLAGEAAGIREDFEARQGASSDLLGITLGYPTLDEVTNGAMPEDVIIVVGRPNKGKSWTLLHMARQAWLAGHSILIVTMEMSSRQLATRFTGLETGINPNLIRRGEVSSFARPLLFETLEGFADRPPVHFMRGNTRKTIADVDALIQETQPDIVYIDAGYLLRPEGKQSPNRREVIAAVIEQIKTVATDRSRPIVVTVQFNREVKKGNKAELELNQIGETDVIAQIASVVVGIRDGEGAHELTRRNAEIMKNREGFLGKFQTHFRFYPMNFAEVSTEELSGEEEMAEAFAD